MISDETPTHCDTFNFSHWPEIFIMIIFNPIYMGRKFLIRPLAIFEKLVSFLGVTRCTVVGLGGECVTPHDTHVLTAEV